MKNSREIQIGEVRMGGNSPLVIQSMTNTNTNDIDATVAQCIRIFERGADMVRITTQSQREVKSLQEIRKKLREKSYHQPLVADVHFLPAVAEEAAKIVEKVRINPGNYIPGKYEGQDKFHPTRQKEQMERIRNKLLPLIAVCKEHNTAIRVGVNHGSLSERILNWYGDTPEGMVESAIEFLSIFRDENFEKLVVSLKASSTRVMVQANRLLVKRMQEEDLVFPIHLGVTEAGDDEEGRIKSAVGICSLLTDGIGDTIRVSLTEDPEEEIPVAMKIRDISKSIMIERNPDSLKNFFFDPFNYKKRETIAVENIGGNNPPLVINSFREYDEDGSGLQIFGYEFSGGIAEAGSLASDFIYLTENIRHFPGIEGLKLIYPLNQNTPEKASGYPITAIESYSDKLTAGSKPVFLKVNKNSLQKLKNQGNGKAVLVYDGGKKNVPANFRKLFKQLNDFKLDMPVILYRKYHSKNKEELMIRASAETGVLFTDGFGDGIWIDEANPEISTRDLREISFSILQACSARISKTEYIACPSCGRTLFNIQSTLKRIKEATLEFKGLKIAVMGCIVNGPGEMADADFGYVGSGPGKVTLYKAREAVKKNIPEESAVEELLKLIHEYRDKV